MKFKNQLFLKQRSIKPLMLVHSISMMIVFSIIVASGIAQATLITPVSITSNTSNTDLLPASRLIDGSGLSDEANINNYTSVTHGPVNSANSWVTTACGFPCDYYAAELAVPVLTMENGSYNANAVRLILTDNYYVDTGDTGGDKVGLSEIKFIGINNSATMGSSVIELAEGTDFFSDRALVSEREHIVSFSVTGDTGPYIVWLATDESGTILSTNNSGTFDFAGEDYGEIIVYHMNFKNLLFLPLRGTNINQFVGWYALSNGISVFRSRLDAGSLHFSDTFVYCGGDGIDDFMTIEDLDITGEPIVDVSTNAFEDVLLDWTYFDFEISRFVEIGPELEQINLDMIKSDTFFLFRRLRTLDSDNRTVNTAFSSSVMVVNECATDCSANAGRFITGTHVLSTESDENMLSVRDFLDNGTFRFDGFTVAETFTYVLADANDIIISPISFNRLFDYNQIDDQANIYLIAAIGEVSGIEAGSALTDIEGCHDLARALTIQRFQEDQTETRQHVEVSELSLQIVGNPVQDLIKLKITASESSESKLTIFNVVGQMEYNKTLTINEGENIIDIDATHFTIGLHYINFTTDNSSILNAVVKN